MVTASIFFPVFFLFMWSLPQSVWAQSEGDLRLVGRENSGSLGRVEVFWKGQWGTICDRNYNGVAGTVCYQLNQSVGKSWALNATNVKRMNKSLKENRQELIMDSTNGTKIALRDVDCGPIYSVPPVMLHILQCDYTVMEEGSAGGCSHDDDLAVHCETTSVDNYRDDDDDDVDDSAYTSEVRLVGGNFSSIGTLEVYLNQTWGNVCYKGFEQASADTVCRQMGYTHAQHFFQTTKKTKRVVWLKESKSTFNCSGTPHPCLYFCFKSGRHGKLEFNHTTCPDGQYMAVQCAFDPQKRDKDKGKDKEGTEFGNPVKCALQRRYSKTPAYVVAIMSASGCFWTITSATIVIVAVSLGIKSCPCYRKYSSTIN